MSIYTKYVLHFHAQFKSLNIISFKGTEKNNFDLIIVFDYDEVLEII